MVLQLIIMVDNNMRRCQLLPAKDVTVVIGRKSGWLSCNKITTT